MQGKYFLLVLMITHSQMVSSHILTSTYLDMSLPACVRILTYTVMNELCPTYGDYSSEEINMPPIPRALSEQKWEHRENIVKKCCTKPCTLTELLSIC